MNLYNIENSIVFSENNLTKRVIYADSKVLTFVLNLKAGQTLPSHQHENSTLVLYVLNGEGQIKINEELGALSAGTVITAKGEDHFEIPVVTEDMSLFVTIGPNPSSALFSKDFN